MFADTLTFPDMYGTDDVVLTRVRQDNYSSEYRVNFPGISHLEFFIRNTAYVDNKRNGITVNRHNVELVETMYTTEVGALAPIRRKMYAVFEADASDDTDQVKQFVSAFAEFFTEANVVKMINFES